MSKSYKAIIEYRDEYSRGRWCEHVCVSSDRDEAIKMALQHCSDCEHRNLRVEEE